MSLVLQPIITTISTSKPTTTSTTTAPTTTTNNSVNSGTLSMINGDLNGTSIERSSPMNIVASATSLASLASNQSIHLEPEQNGVSNTDVDWLARGSSLKEKGRSRSRSNSLPPVPNADTIPQLGKSKPTVSMSSAHNNENSIVHGGVGVGVTIEEREEEEENGTGTVPNGVGTAKTNGNVGGGSGGSTNGNDANDKVVVNPPSLSPRTAATTHILNDINTTPATPSKLSQGLNLARSLTHEEKDPIGSELTRSLSVSAANLGKYTNERSSSFSTSRRSSWFHSLSSKFSSHNTGNSPNQNRRNSATSSSSVRTASFSSTDEKPQPKLPLSSQSQPQSQSPTSPLFSASYVNNKNLPTNRILDTHPPRTSSPKLSPEIAIGGNSLSPTSTSTINNNIAVNKQQSGSLVNRLRRLSVRSNGSQNDVSSISSPEERIILNKNTTRKPLQIPELRDSLPPRVRFSSDVFDHDPPQQIPARNPRTGNITFGPNGEINRDPLPANTPGYPMSAYSLPRNYSISTQQASQSAYESAIRVANSVKSFGSGGGVSIFKSKSSASSTSTITSSSNLYDDDDFPSGGKSNNFQIDKPMHSERMGSSTNEDDAGDEDSDEKELTLETVYTRCCHLREILPIAATMKQIKDRKPPLEVIKMMNPRPTLIEILSLSDFLAVVPVRMLIFDNVSLTTEQFRIILSSVLQSKHLERLSLRNLNLDLKGWKIFCAFFCENKSIGKLDLSMQRQSSKQQNLDRSALDWDLFTKALIARGGCEELLLNGCMVPSNELKNLILNGCSISTKRLGLALNDLLFDDTKVIMKWAKDPSSVCEGLDLGGNNLDHSWDSIKEIISGNGLKYLSLNSTGLADVIKANEIFGGVCSHSNLRMVDLSSNPDLFPKFTQTLADILPKFKDLRRFHLDSNNLSSEDVMLLADSFARCPKLVHISLLDNRKLDATACAALAVATHISNTIYTVETDGDLWPVILQRRLAHNCLVNMELIAGRISKDYKKDDDEGLFGKEDIMNTGNYIAMAAKELLKSIKEDNEEVQGHLVVSEMVRRAKQVRIGIRKTMEELFEKRRSENGLILEEKERLIRLCFLDGTLEDVLNKYNQTKHSRIKPHKLSTTNVTNDGGDSTALGGPSVIEVCDNILRSTGSKDVEVNLLPLLPDDRNIAALPTPNPAHPDLAIASVSEHEEIKSLSRKSSTTSLHRKEQELEEGELHKFGTFIRSHRDSQVESSDDSDEDNNDSDNADNSDDIKGNNKLNNKEIEIKSSTGEELRRKILEAKGSQSVSELIQRLQKLHGPELDRILTNPEKDIDETIPLSKIPTETSELDETIDSVVDDIANAFT